MKNIIQEEVKKFLREAYIIGGDDFKFRQAVPKVHFSGYNTFTTEFDTEIPESNIVANWGLSFWLNDSGVENFVPDVHTVEGTFTVQMFDLHSDELKQETSKNIADFQWKFVINEAALVKNQSLYIKEMTFDFEDKTCTVSF